MVTITDYPRYPYRGLLLDVGRHFEPASTLTMCDSSVGIGCTIKWGDGSTASGDVTGTNATGTRVNSLYTISGEHTYARPGTYHGVVIVSAGNVGPVRADFTVIRP